LSMISLNFRLLLRSHKTAQKNSVDTISKLISDGRRRNSYLTGRDELQGAKGGLQVLCVALEVEQSTGNRGLQLGGVLPGRRVEGNLVDGSHGEQRGAAEGAG